MVKTDATTMPDGTTRTKVAATGEEVFNFCATGALAEYVVTTE